MIPALFRFRTPCARAHFATMLFWFALALSLVITGAVEEAGSCVGKASLLQTQKHRTARTLAPENLDEGAATVEGVATAAPAAYATVPDELLAKLIVSTPWNCDLLPQPELIHTIDPRAPT